MFIKLLCRTPREFGNAIGRGSESAEGRRRGPKGAEEAEGDLRLCAKQTICPRVALTAAAHWRALAAEPETCASQLRRGTPSRPVNLASLNSFQLLDWCTLKHFRANQLTCGQKALQQLLTLGEIFVIRWQFAKPFAKKLAGNANRPIRSWPARRGWHLF